MSDNLFAEFMTSRDGLIGGLIYTLLSVSSASMVDPLGTVQATLPYLNNAIGDCSVRNMAFTWTNGSRELGGSDSISVNVSLRWLHCDVCLMVCLRLLSLVTSFPGLGIQSSWKLSSQFWTTTAQL